MAAKTFTVENSIDIGRFAWTSAASPTHFRRQLPTRSEDDVDFNGVLFSKDRVWRVDENLASLFSIPEHLLHRFWGVFEPGVRNSEFQTQGSGTPNLEFRASNPGFEHRSSS